MYFFWGRTRLERFWTRWAQGLRQQLVIALLLFVVFLALRLPLRAQALVNWDAANFALGTRIFDVQHHQPHPPGYIGYVALGALLNRLTGDANASLTLLSAVSGGVAPAALFILAARWMARPYALLSAVQFGLSPVLWYYSEVALSYALETALVIPLVWACSVARAERSARHLFFATVLLTLLGAVRQSGMALLLPLWGYAAWAFPRRTLVRAALLLVVTTFVWMVPLVWSTGDPWVYVRESAALAAVAGGRTWLLSLNFWGIAQNLSFVGIGLLLGLNVSLVPMLLTVRSGMRSLAALGRRERMVLVLWAIPALVTYLFIHTGQLGYVLLILPIGFLWSGAALQALHGRMRQQHVFRQIARSPVLRHAALAGLLGLVMVLSLVILVPLPKSVYALVRSAPESGSVPIAQATGPSDPELDDRIRQYTLEVTAVHWRQLTSLIRRYDPSTTALVTHPTSGGSFRQLSYYFPEYRVYGVGRDPQGYFGHLFTARDNTSDYRVRDFPAARSVLGLPPLVRCLIVPDAAVYSRLAEHVPRVTVELESGATVVVAFAPSGAQLVFSDGTMDIEPGFEETPALEELERACARRAD